MNDSTDELRVSLGLAVAFEATKDVLGEEEEAGYMSSGSGESAKCRWRAFSGASTLRVPPTTAGDPNDAALMPVYVGTVLIWSSEPLRLS